MSEHPTGLLDTSTVILLPRLRDPGGLPDAPLISAITLAELSVGPLVATTDTERAAFEKSAGAVKDLVAKLAD